MFFLLIIQFIHIISYVSQRRQASYCLGYWLVIYSKTLLSRSDLVKVPFIALGDYHGFHGLYDTA